MQTKSFITQTKFFTTQAKSFIISILIIENFYLDYFISIFQSIISISQCIIKSYIFIIEIISNKSFKYTAFNDIIIYNILNI